MEAVWFALVSAMLAVYVVLDGFDFGVGILHRLVARTDDERRTVLAAIGPVWDGNEVWLVAAAGVLFMGFPRVYSAAASVPAVPTGSIAAEPVECQIECPRAWQGVK